jgi:hypothetical protein
MSAHTVRISRGSGSSALANLAGRGFDDESDSAPAGMGGSSAAAGSSTDSANTGDTGAVAAAAGQGGGHFNAHHGARK